MTHLYAEAILSYMTLRDRLANRLSDLSLEQVDCILHFLEKYDITLLVSDFDEHGVILKDQLGKTIRICYLNEDGVGKGWITNPHADIAVIYNAPIPQGWMYSSRLQGLDNKKFLRLNSLHLLPETLVFTEPCQHLEVWGGFHYEKDWVCANCEERLVFVE